MLGFWLISFSVPEDLMLGLIFLATQLKELLGISLCQIQNKRESYNIYQKQVPAPMVERMGMNPKPQRGLND